MEVSWTALCPMLESCYPGANTHYSLLHPSPASVLVLGETHGLKLPTLARHLVTIPLSYFRTGGPGKEHEINKPLQIRRIQERSKGEEHPTDLPESSSLEYILREQCVHRQEGP